MRNARRENLIRVFVIILIIAIIVIVSIYSHNRKGNYNSPGRDTISLFNGKDLANWHVFLASDTVNPAGTFFVKDGTLMSSGDPKGYIRTTEPYSNYQLLVEWRWPEEPGNSGVFLHIKKDSIWPVCLECQLKSGNAGDFVAFPGFTFSEQTDKEKKSVPKIEDTSEKLAGEWNLYDIRVRDDSITVYVNGILQNIASHTTARSGFIALQSEGSPVQFRNIRIVKLEDQ